MRFDLFQWRENFNLVELIQIAYYGDGINYVIDPKCVILLGVI